MPEETDSEAFFTKVLALKEPWVVQSVVLSEDAKRTDLKVGVRYGQRIPCPNCGEPCDVHDRVRRTWRHLDVCDSECYVVAEIPRTRCEKCGILQLKVPWAREYVSYTNEFERKAMELLRSMPISKVAGVMRIGRSALEGMIKHHVDRHLDRMDLSSVKRIFLDETSSKRRHRYITVIADADTKRIIFITEGKGAESIGRFSEWLIDHNGDPRNIELVSCDFSIPFMAGIKEYLPSADIVYDRFHLAKMANDALDKIRAQNHNLSYKRIRFKLLKNWKDLSEEDRKIVFGIKEENKVIGLAYEMKESLIQLYDYPDIESASEHVRQWLDWVSEEGQPRMKALGWTVSRHFHKILNWYHNRMSNGFMEGLNGMIQTTKRMARGYPNTQNFISMIYFRHGRLDI